MTTVKLFHRKKLILSFSIPAGEMIIPPLSGHCYILKKQAYIVDTIATQHVIIRDFVDHQINVYLEKIKMDAILKHSQDVFQKEYEKSIRKAKKAERLE